MRLHIILTNDKGKQRSISANESIVIELKHKNTLVKRLKFQLEENNWEFQELKAQAKDELDKFIEKVDLPQ